MCPKCWSPTVRGKRGRHRSSGADEDGSTSGRNATRRKVEAQSRGGGDFGDDVGSLGVTTENAVTSGESLLLPPPPPLAEESLLSTRVDWLRDLPRSLWAHTILDFLALDDIYIVRVTCRTMSETLAAAAGRRFATVAARLLPRLGWYAYRDLGRYAYTSRYGQPSKVCVDQQWHGRPLVECCCVAMRYLPALAAVADVEAKLDIFCKSACLPEAILIDDPQFYLRTVPHCSDVAQLRFVLSHIRTHYFDELLQRRAALASLQPSLRPTTAPAPAPPPPNAYIYVRRYLERLGITPDSRILTRCWTWLAQSSAAS